MNTHVHADHITGTGELKRLLPGCKSVIAGVSNAVADVKVKHGDKIKFGKYELEARSTPGHTNGMCLIKEDGNTIKGDVKIVLPPFLKGVYAERKDFARGGFQKIIRSQYSQHNFIKK